MISQKYSCIFVHIPKTGGSSVESVIWPDLNKRTEKELWMGLVKPFYNKYQTGGLQHLKAKHILQEVGEEVFNSFFKFSIVRNPFDKSVSQYEYMQEREDLREFIGMKKNTEFKKYIELTQKKKHVQWEHQWKFLYDDFNVLLVDMVIKFEQIEIAMKDIIKVLNFKNSSSLGPLPHENKSLKRRAYKEYYDQESKEMISSIYSKDLELFGYQFD